MNSASNKDTCSFLKFSDAKCFLNFQTEYGTTMTDGNYEELFNFLRVTFTAKAISIQFYLL